MTVEFHVLSKQYTYSTDDVSTLALKPMGWVNRIPNQRVPVASQNGDLSPQTFLKNQYNIVFCSEEFTERLAELD